jgi:hypothetical protein
MKHKLTSILALGLMALLVVGLSLLLENWSVGGDYEPPASEALPTASIAPTLSYSELMTRAATDIWSIPTPIHTPIIPTERPRQPRPTPESVTPYPTPTFLPDLGVRIAELVEISVSPTLRIAEGESFRLINLDLDGHTLAGVVDSEDKVAVVTIDLETGQRRFLAEESRAAVYRLRTSKKYIVWSMSWRDDARGILHVYDLQTGQTSRIAEHIYDFDISGDTIVWSQVGDGWDIWGYNLAQLEAFPIVAHPDSQTGSLISEHWIVYRDAADRSEDGIGLYAINLDTGEDIRLGTIFSSSSQYVPPLYTIDAPWVVWSTEATLHFYNLETHTTYSVPVEACFSSTSRPEYLALSENTLIFTCGQRMGYDIERDVFFSLPLHTSETLDGEIEGCTISGNRLVWVLTKDVFGSQEQSHIYTAQIERSP